MKHFSIFLLTAFAVLGCAPEGGNGGGTTDAGPATATCGNDIVEDGEQCDDGNTRNRDGCDRNCQDEGGDRCGDGEVTGAEECDDGNTIPGDGCDHRCRTEDLADGNDTRETAEAIEGGAVDGVIGVPGDLDWYSFTAEEGQWVAMGTTANADDDPTKIDTVITLYDADGNQVAENDDGYPRRNTDSQLILRLPGAGTYFVKVQEWSSWQNETAEGDRSYTYRLFVNVLAIEDIGGGAVYGEEGGNDADSAITLDTETKALILSDLADSSDVDVYSFSVTDETKAHFSAQLMPLGTDGYGSTATGTRMWVTPAGNADSITARIAHVAKTDEVSPGGLALGDYHLWVAHSGDAVGANDFYVIKFGLAGDNPPELSEDTNDTLASAEALEANTQGDATRYFILANMGAGDVDYYSFELAAGKSISVACGSASSGSGVEGFRAELRSADDNVIAGADETDEGVYIRQIAGQPAGTYYLRLSATGVSSEIDGTWARCGVHTGPQRG
jgi:cysteine-rich repeat protein